MTDLIIVEGFTTFGSSDQAMAQCSHCGAAYPESTCLVWHDCAVGEWKPVIWEHHSIFGYWSGQRYWGLSLRCWGRRRRGLRMPVGRPT